MKNRWIKSLPISDKNKNLLISVSFYFISITIGVILNKLFPSDMCNPGLGAIFFIFIIPFTIIGLTIWNFILLTKGKKENVFSFWFHLLVLIIGLFLLKFV